MKKISEPIAAYHAIRPHVESYNEKSVNNNAIESVVRCDMLAGARYCPSVCEPHGLMMRAFTAIVFFVAAASQTHAVQQNVVVVFDTEKGTIEMEVDGVHAPVTAANFVWLPPGERLQSRATVSAFG